MGFLRFLNAFESVVFFFFLESSQECFAFNAVCMWMIMAEFYTSSKTWELSVSGKQDEQII